MNKENTDGIRELIGDLKQEAVEEYKKENGIGWIRCSERISEKKVELMCKCPICGSDSYWHVGIKDGNDWFEQLGVCEKCGYRVSQCFGPALEAYKDIKRGIKTEYGYIKKDVRKHRRVRRKRHAPKLEINPQWVCHV